VLPRGRIPLAALLALLAVTALGPGAAMGQVTAPRLVEEGDEPVDEPAAGDPQAVPHRPRAPGDGVAPPTRASGSPPAQAGTAAVPPPPGAGKTAAAAGATLPPPPPPPTATPDLARQIVPVSTSHGQLLEAWAARRAALREADPARAEAARKVLLAVKSELGIDNLVALSAAEVRDAYRALAANLPAEAAARADTAVALAPDFADAHLARARALFALAPGSVGPPLAALRDAIGAAAREPHTLRAFYGDLVSAALAAVFTAAIATVLLLLLRRIRLFLHDFHHLPLLRGSAPAQTTFLALVLLGVPVAFGLGPLAIVGTAALVSWLYLSRQERLVVSAALLALLALPWAAGAAARITAWTGSAAETVHEIEHGAVSDEDAAAVHATAAASPTPAPILAALGRLAKRRGDLDRALRLYEEATAADPRAPEVLVNRGNVLFLQGDLDGAKAAYLSAQDQAGGDLVVLGAAHYNLSKLYLRTSEMDRSAAARDRAEREAGAFLRARGSDADFSANRYLVDVPVPPRKIAALATGDGIPDAVQAWVRARLLGPLPRWVLPWGAGGFLAALWLLALAGRGLAPALACETCGRPACRRCAGVGGACGQCVNVFHRKGVVDARDRLRKEAQVRRHEQLVRAATRVLAVVGGGAGQIFHGAAVLGAVLLLATLFAGFVLWFWRGIMPPPQPSAYVLAGKLAVAAPLGVLLWALAVRDAFRRTRS
jgi:tetratricopeptide (TPR) repeat protein